MRRIIMITSIITLGFGGTPFKDYNLGVSPEYTKIENQVSIKCVKYENKFQKWNECKAKVIKDLRRRKVIKK